MQSLCNTNVEAYTKTNACLTTLGCALTENMLWNPGYLSNYFYEKKQNFLVAQEQKLSTRADWVLLEHCLVIILRKIKNIKDNSVHFALIRKNSLNGTSFVCRVIFLFLSLFSLDINYFHVNVYQWNVMLVLLCEFSYCFCMSPHSWFKKYIYL